MNDIEKLAKELFSKGINVNQYLRDNHPELGEDAIISLSYDTQAGSYSKEMAEKNEIYKVYGNAIVEKLSPYFKTSDSILDAGCGELTGSYQLIDAARHLKYVGIDGSFSRLLAGKKFLTDQGVSSFADLDLVASSLINIPLSNSSIDIVFTSHAIEPNSLNSSRIIKELARVSKRYIALFEPCYEDASLEMKAHMDKHNYARGIRHCCEMNGLELIDIDKNLPSIEPILNKTTFMLFTKSESYPSTSRAGYKYVTPDCYRYELEELESSTLFCRETDTMYPSLHGIRLVNLNNAVQLADCSSLV
ncbi:MAG: hypothetical protein CL831_10760 [Crocinitomicaceae bacterium]|nr:hypothetical protein [Crocinitomicaceae bacterium]